jgi:hypothetical protein
MPKGVYPHTHLKPKVYPAEMVAEVRRRYEAGQTQIEIAVAISTTQKVVWRIMLNHDIRTRVAAKRDQWGSNNDSWRGDAAGYQAQHLRVETVRGKPASCFRCGKHDAGLRYEWANLTGCYEDTDDYERMCVPCHRQYDSARRAVTGRRTSPVRRSA